ncbi:hypothetical protein FOL47_001657 [Perkinsus chesapeaki]|uniref:Uncharacterized protein n=1 Tax=Perkinsus chesapeaki TaxID=330153 RepID=A0A7J6MJR3_PERCH|nr:hypothetical protein FOL47_001657 [Perkinsus chesapeaki]
MRTLLERRILKPRILSPKIRIKLFHKPLLVSNFCWLKGFEFKWNVSSNGHAKKSGEGHSRSPSTEGRGSRRHRSIFEKLLCYSGDPKDEKEIESTTSGHSAKSCKRDSSKSNQSRPNYGHYGLVGARSNSEECQEAVPLERERSVYPHYHGRERAPLDDDIAHLHRDDFPEEINSDLVSSAGSSSSETLAAKTIGRRMMYGRDRWRHDLPSWFDADIEKQRACTTSGAQRYPAARWRADGAGLRTYSNVYDDPSFYRSFGFGTHASGSVAQPGLRPYRSSVLDDTAPVVSGTATGPSNLRRYRSEFRPSTARVDLSVTSPARGSDPPPPPPQKHHHHKHHNNDEAHRERSKQVPAAAAAGKPSQRPKTLSVHREANPTSPLSLSIPASKAPGKPSGNETHPADAAGGGGRRPAETLQPTPSPEQQARRSPISDGRHTPVKMASSAKDSFALSADDDDDDDVTASRRGAGQNGAVAPARIDSFTSNSDAEAKAWAEHEARREKLEERRRAREEREEQRRKNIEALKAASNYTMPNEDDPWRSVKDSSSVAGVDCTPRGSIAPNGIRRESSALSLYADRLNSSRRYQPSPRASLYAYQQSPRVAAASGLCRDESPATRGSRYNPIYQQPALKSTQSAAYASSPMATPVPLTRAQSAYRTPVLNESPDSTVAATPEAVNMRGTPRKNSSLNKSEEMTAPLAPIGALNRQTSAALPPGGLVRQTSSAAAAAAELELPQEGLSRHTSRATRDKISTSSPRSRDEIDRLSSSSGDTSLSSSFIGHDSITRTPIAERSPAGPSPASSRRDLPPPSPSTRVPQQGTSTPRSQLGVGLAAAVNKKEWNGINSIFG